ncbi:MAG: TraB/GumN family protein [Alphaproteobacteria bacterium]|nr:TraB/GumN family protein [Alphaproteobacteria bacterium]
MRLKTWFGRIAGAVAALGLVGAAPPPAPLAHVAAPARAHPGLWKLQDRDTIVYLFGTIHALPDNLAWRTPAFDRAFASAGEFRIEVGNIDDQQAVAGALMKAGLAEGLPPILERVPPEKRAALKSAIDESGFPAAGFDRMKSWMAALVLLTVEFRRIGLSPEQGAERKLVAEWKAKGKSVDGFETAAEQFGFLDGLSPQAQSAFLAAAADTPGAAKAQFAAMLKAWQAGDVAAIARTFDDETTMSPELRRVLMKERNARWARWLAARMAKPGIVFVAVGAGHLAGPDSVLAMLAAKGLKPVRVQ